MARTYSQEFIHSQVKPDGEAPRTGTLRIRCDRALEQTIKANTDNTSAWLREVIEAAVKAEGWTIE